MIEGIDVSRWQGEIDWPAVKDEEISFAVAKASEGADHSDSRFAANWAGIADAFIAFRGAYHFFRMTSPPAAQAESFGDLVEAGGVEPGDFFVLDIERRDGKSGEQIHAAAGEWVSAVSERFPEQRILIYSGHFWRDVIRSEDNLGCELWLPAYVKAVDGWVPDRFVPRAWQEALIWQHTSSGSLPGIDGRVDMNRCRLSEEELGEWLRFELTGPLFEQALPAPPTLRRGARGDAVAGLQRALAAAGFDPGAIDGIFGRRTRDAVRSFQESRGLSVDGVVGPATWAALARAGGGQDFEGPATTPGAAEDGGVDCPTLAETARMAFLEDFPPQPVPSVEETEVHYEYFNRVTAYRDVLHAHLRGRDEEIPLYARSVETTAMQTGRPGSERGIADAEAVWAALPPELAELPEHRDCEIVFSWKVGDEPLSSPITVGSYLVLRLDNLIGIALALAIDAPGVTEYLLEVQRYARNGRLDLYRPVPYLAYPGSVSVFD